MNFDGIKNTYQTNLRLFEDLLREAKFEINHALDQTDIKYHSVTGRVKDLSSLLRKVGGRRIEDPFRDLPDIVGTRIVTLFLSDIERIMSVMTSTFDVIAKDNKIDDSDPRLFGYFSVHLHAKIKASFSGTRYDPIKNFVFEIQIRTIAMDAWASASHYLSYKNEADVPVDLKRDFHALSGLFYVADKHFEMFFRSRSDNLLKLDSAIKQRTTMLHDLDLDTLIVYLRDKFSRTRTF